MPLDRSTFIASAAAACGVLLPRLCSASPAGATGPFLWQTPVLSVWRIDGEAVTTVPWSSATAKLLYPPNLGINVKVADGSLSVEFSRPHMAWLASG